MKISELHIMNFKCLSDVRFEFGNLNLLAGANGCGKSSLIHSLLLLRQSYEQLGNVDTLLTYGKYINLGVAKDILYEYAEESDDIAYDIRDEDGNRIELQYNYTPDTRMVKINTPYVGSLNHINIFGESFEYLSAERIVPQTIYSSVSQEDCLGIHGENALNFLEKYGDSMEVDHTFWDETGNKYLLYYVNKWLSEVFQGFSLRLTQISEADAVSLRYAERSRDRIGSAHRAINVGFGITYVLPILVALFKAKNDDMIILENPEAHLHPRAQRKLGELLAKTASTGAQIIVETHSDHILNGIRISAKRKIVDSGEIKMFFFMKEDIGNRYNVNIFSPNINDNGDIDIWPEGFFDEWDNALAELF